MSTRREVTIAAISLSCEVQPKLTRNAERASSASMPIAATAPVISGFRSCSPQDLR